MPKLMLGNAENYRVRSLLIPEITGRPQWVGATPSALMFTGKVVCMAQMGRPGLSATQQGELWHRWKAGQSMSEIGRALGRDHSSIYYLLSYRGGIVPAVRRRARIALTLAEREDSSRGIAAGWSIRGIAERLGRSA